MKRFLRFLTKNMPQAQRLEVLWVTPIMIQLQQINPKSASAINLLQFHSAYADINDAFTKDSANGNGKLDYKVGLITADELTLAGSGWDGYDASAYLFTSEPTWSASPSHFSTHGYACEFFVTYGSANYEDVI